MSFLQSGCINLLTDRNALSLAKRVTNADKTDDDLYRLTGNTGSLRYMAPEIALNHPYSLSVDVYSFGVLFWQLCALSIPYSGYSCKMHAEFVVGKGHRPKPEASWPSSWTSLMRQCWRVEPKERPSFEHIYKVMNEEVNFWTEDDAMSNEESGKDSEKIKPRLAKNVFKIKARRDSQRLDIDTRLAKLDGPSEKEEQPTNRIHDSDVV